MTRTLYHRIYGRKRRNLALGGRRLKPCPQNHGIEYRYIRRPSGILACRKCRALQDHLRYVSKMRAGKQNLSWRAMNRFYWAWQAVSCE